LNEPNGSPPAERSGAENAPGAARPSCWETTAILTKEPQELLDHLNRHTRTALEKIDPIGRDCNFTFSRVEVDLGRVRLAEARSTSVHMQGQASSLMTVIVSEQGQSLFKRKAGGEVVSSRGDAAIIAAQCDMIFQSSPDDVRYIVQLPQQHIVELLQESEHRRVKELGPPLRLEFSTPVATSFHRAVNFIWRQQVVPTGQLRAAYDEILLHGLARLLAPVLLDDRPDRPPDPGPAHIHRACELIRARAMEPIRVAEIARELGITPRCLQSGFRKHLATTPHQFLRDCRLDLAHHMLSASLAGQTTTSIAYECGFGHLGDFAQIYRSRFGESPSETLRRSRGRHLVSS
jgi:AraC-like DNA-binding protein